MKHTTSYLRQGQQNLGRLLLTIWLLTNCNLEATLADRLSEGAAASTGVLANHAPLPAVPQPGSIQVTRAQDPFSNPYLGLQRLEEAGTQRLEEARTQQLLAQCYQQAGVGAAIVSSLLIFAFSYLWTSESFRWYQVYREHSNASWQLVLRLGIDSIVFSVVAILGTLALEYSLALWKEGKSMMKHLACHELNDIRIETEC